MYVIGLTGPSGAGKSLVSSFWKKKGLSVIDADDVYHRLLIPPSPCVDAIAEHFGSGVLQKDGSLDRKALGGIVFSDPAELEALNTIAHRFVMEKIREELSALEKNGASVAVLDAPQLFEAGADRLCDKVVAVLAPREARMERIMTRDGIDEASAARRINAQMSEGYFREHADVILENDSDTETLLKSAEELLSCLGVTP